VVTTGGLSVNTGSTLRLAGGATLNSSGGTFTNNGTLDILTGSFSAPGGFINNGVVIDSSSLRVKSVSLASGTMTLLIDSYTGHTYQLQRSTTPDAAGFANTGSTQDGATGSTLTFTYGGVTGAQGYFRVVVNP
jgi:hypothetical protein